MTETTSASGRQEGGPAPPTADPTSSGAPVEQPEPPYRRPLNLLAYPYFSQRERDRRWNLTRAAMAAHGIDCLVVPNNTEHGGALQADARYLTHVGGGADADVAVVFPLEGEPTALVADREGWVHTQPWCQELREVEGPFTSSVVARLTELTLPNRRVGVVDARRDETASFRSLSFLRAELPDVEWTDFTDELHTIRAVKSDEEIAFLEHSAGIVDAAYVAALAAAHPGVNDYAVWAAVVEEICRHGSELPVRLRWIGDHQPGQMLSQPTLRRVEQGWLFLSRVEAAWGGYRARATLPFSCGEPAPPYPELVSLLVDIWNETCERIRAGISIARVQEVVAHSAAQHAPHRGPLAGVEISFALNGCGPGLDLPRIAGREVRTEDAQRVIAPGWCFALTLAATAGPHRLLWGDTVAVSDRGARRLGSAPQGIRIAS